MLLTGLRGGWSAGKWEWDGRLSSALSTIGRASEAEATSALTAAMPQVWTGKTLAQAPPLLQQICGRTGGLMAGQQAFSAALPDEVILYALWWPWGGGANISVRIGCSHESVLPAVRAAFGV